MSLHVIKAGMQTTVQGRPVRGQRHLGMPAAGAADCLSLALANQLVGQPFDSGALEITLDRAIFETDHPCLIAVTGATTCLSVDGNEIPLHQSHLIKAGSNIQIDPARNGCRSYLAIRGTIEGGSLWDSPSTYLPARLGGFHGRTLRVGDVLNISPSLSSEPEVRATPDTLQPRMGNQFILRVTAGPEQHLLEVQALGHFYDSEHPVGQRVSRMGIGLAGQPLDVPGDATMASAPVFPGTIQLPPDGHPILLGPDAQTTGGYPRIAQVIRADRHLLGQLRTGAKVRIIEVTAKQAQRIYRAKLELLAPWLGRMNLW